MKTSPVPVTSDLFPNCSVVPASTSSDFAPLYSCDTGSVNQSIKLISQINNQVTEQLYREDVSGLAKKTLNNFFIYAISIFKLQNTISNPKLGEKKSNSEKNSRPQFKCESCKLLV